MRLTLGFSPCPNDTFIFDALANRKIDTGDLEFDTVLEDVETLNKLALKGELDITKLSFPAYFKSLNNYILLKSGSALGKGVGPLLISRKSENDKNPGDRSIAIPGENTTANLLLSFAFPNHSNRIPMLFSTIEDSLLDSKTDWGVIIHENRFTYQQKGLHKVVDLGQYWEEKTGIPIPLGGIAIKRSFDTSIASRINALIRQSLEYSYANYPTVSSYVKDHSQNMNEEVMRQHIDLYVNNFSLDLGETGMQAIEKLHKVFISKENNTPPDVQLFI